MVAVTIARTHCTYSRMDGQAELAWMAWLNSKRVYPRTVTLFNSNPARPRVISLMRSTTLPVTTNESVALGSPSCNYTEVPVLFHSTVTVQFISQQ